LKEFRPDVVHVQDHYPLTCAIIAAARWEHVPVVGTNHFLPENWTHYLGLGSLPHPVLRRLLWSSMLQVYNKLDAVVGPSRTAVDILREQGLRAPVYAISCGVDLNRFRPIPDLDQAQMRRKYRLDPERRLFLFVGRVDPEKRLDVVINALARLKSHNVQLAIAGQGRHSETVEKQARDLGLRQSGQVVLTGHVPAEDLPLLLNSADAFVMASEAELQSIATLEAMACGRPILAADARALPELVEDGLNGRLFRAGDPDELARVWQSMLDASSQWPAMGKASRLRALQHNFPETVRSYINLYSVVGAQPRRAQHPLFRAASGTQAVKTGLPAASPRLPRGQPQ
jgi:glycosyltransferase involved in cell wall biosynthesis